MTGRRRLVLAMTATLLGAGVPIGTVASAATIHVEVKELAFIPADTKARVGDTIEWTNKDFVAHTATARDGAWDVKLPPHAVGRIVLKKPGTIEYYCRYHPNMKGEINVSPDTRPRP